MKYASAGSEQILVHLQLNYLKTYENLRFWTIEDLKSKTVLILYLKTYENLRFWTIEELKSKTVLILCLKTYENLRF